MRRLYTFNTYQPAKKGEIAESILLPAIRSGKVHSENFLDSPKCSMKSGDLGIPALIKDSRFRSGHRLGMPSMGYTAGAHQEYGVRNLVRIAPQVPFGKSKIGTSFRLAAPRTRITRTPLKSAAHIHHAPTLTSAKAKASQINGIPIHAGNIDPATYFRTAEDWWKKLARMAYLP
jgi:purine-nucleoside phosphorylase